EALGHVVDDEDRLRRRGGRRFGAGSGGGGHHPTPPRLASLADPPPAGEGEARPCHAPFTSPWRGEVDRPERSEGWAGGGDGGAAGDVLAASPHPGALRAIADASHRRSFKKERRPKAASALPLQGRVKKAVPHAPFTSPWRGEVDRPERSEGWSGGADGGAAGDVLAASPHPGALRAIADAS